MFARIPIQSQGSFVHTEILAKANFLGKVLTDVPVECRKNAKVEKERTRYRQRWRDAWRVLVRPDFGPAAIADRNDEVPMTNDERITNAPMPKNPGEGSLDVAGEL